MNPKDNITNLSVSNTIQSKLDASFTIHSQRTAIVYGSKQYRYNEISKASDQVSQWLISNKMSSGKHIALCLEDRVQLIIWILGILKSRSVFIPLDYHHPEGRIQQLLEISESDLLITDRSKKQRLLIEAPKLEVVAYEDLDFSVSVSFDEVATTVPFRR